MKQTAVAPVIEYLARSRDVIQAAIDDPDFAGTIAAIVDRVAVALGVSCCWPAMAAAPPMPSTSPASSCRGSITTGRRRRRSR